MARDPMKKLKFEGDLPQYVGMTYMAGKKQLKLDGKEPIVVWKNGDWVGGVRDLLLRPNEVNLVIDKGIIKRAYRIM